MGVIVSEPDLSAEAGPACVLGCLAVCLLLLLRTERASRVSGGLRGCKPRGARGVCALRRAACRRLPGTAYTGLTRGVCRTALLLVLASLLGGCDATGTVCSHEPTACNGTYSGTELCAPLPACHVPPTNVGNGGGRNLVARVGRVAQGGDRGRHRVGSGHATHLPPSVHLPWTPLHSSFCSGAPLSQVPSDQRPERQRTLAARAPHRADMAVSRRTSAHPPPGRGRAGGGRAYGGWRRVGEGRASHLPPSVSVAILPRSRSGAPLAGTFSATT